MKHPFILIEDADPDPSLSDAIRSLNSDWELQFRKITNEGDYNQVIAMLTAIQAGDLTAAFDLDYSNKAGKKTKTPYWDAMDADRKAVIPAQTKHGVNALLCLLSNFNHGNCLLVVSSNFTGDKMDSGRALRAEIQKIADRKRPHAVIHAYFPGGPLTVGNPFLTERLQEIKGAWDAFFGSMASRLRASQNAGWFSDTPELPPSPLHMIHAEPSNEIDNDNIKTDLSRWLACVAEVEESVANGALDTLFASNGFGFYKHAVEHVTGACALHCGRKRGKALNMHGVALIACCYAGDFAGVFNGITWPADDSARLIEPAEDTNPSQELLYLLVGKPSEQATAQPSGVFGILGKHNGKNGGTTGVKTVTSIELNGSKVIIKFAIRGKELADKFTNGNATGNAFCALTQLRATVVANGVTVLCSGTESNFTLTIAKP